MVGMKGDYNISEIGWCIDIRGHSVRSVRVVFAFECPLEFCMDVYELCRSTESTSPLGPGAISTFLQVRLEIRGTVDLIEPLFEARCKAAGLGLPSNPSLWINPDVNGRCVNFMNPCSS